MLHYFGATGNRLQHVGNILPWGDLRCEDHLFDITSSRWTSGGTTSWTELGRTCELRFGESFRGQYWTTFEGCRESELAWSGDFRRTSFSIDMSKELRITVFDGRGQLRFESSSATAWADCATEPTDGISYKLSAKKLVTKFVELYVFNPQVQKVGLNSALPVNSAIPVKPLLTWEVW